MNYLDYISMDMEIWFLPKKEIVETLWINYGRWSQLKALGVNYEVDRAPEWFLLLDSLSYHWSLHDSLSNNFEEFYYKLRELLAKKRVDIIDCIYVAVKEAVDNKHFVVEHDAEGQ